MAQSRADAPDKLASAMAAVEQADQQVAMQSIPITVSSTGRPIVLTIPVDISDGEIAEFAGWMLTGLINAKRAERAKAPASRILVPVGSIRPS